MTMIFEGVSFYYGKDPKTRVPALKNINFTIRDHEFVGLIGHTGSGKSTLVQHMNGLNLPAEGRVTVNGITTSQKGANLKKLRQEVGLVFQYPEDQLFEETIYKDIAFGPKNLGLDEKEIDQRVRDAMAAVGLDFEKLHAVSPFEVSGGQKRRVAIAGVLALHPTYLVLDEPTAGLDPRGREEILGEIRQIYEQNPALTIVLVTHSMEDIAQYANRILVVDRGEIAMDGKPEEVFSKREDLERRGLSVPQITKLMSLLHEKNPAIAPQALTVEEAFRILSSYYKERREGDHE